MRDCSGSQVTNGIDRHHNHGDDEQEKAEHSYAAFLASRIVIEHPDHLRQWLLSLSTPLAAGQWPALIALWPPVLRPVAPTPSSRETGSSPPLSWWGCALRR